jgi:hypothetical protein
MAEQLGNHYDETKEKDPTETYTFKDIQSRWHAREPKPDETETKKGTWHCYQFECLSQTLCTASVL